MLAALLWQVVFLLGVRDVWWRGRRDGMSSMAFQTRRPGIAWLLRVLGILLGASALLIAVQGLVRGSAIGFCRRCVRDGVAWTDQPFVYVMLLLVQIELAIAMFFVAYLAGNTLRAIRSARLS